MAALDGSAPCSGAWIKAENPAIFFTTPDPSSVEVYSTDELTFEPAWTPNQDAAGSIMITTKVAPRCTGLVVAGKTFFGLETVTGEGVLVTEFYQYDRRIRWIANSLANPATATADEYAGGRHGVCPNVPRSFVNQDSCVRLPPGTCMRPGYPPHKLRLDIGTLRQWYLDSTKYVYAVTGLRLEVGAEEWIPPCTAHHVSRWVRVATTGGCTQSGPASKNHRISWGHDHAPGSTITINAGDSVTWVWDLDSDEHNLVSGTPQTGDQAETRTNVFGSDFRTKVGHGQWQLLAAVASAVAA